MNNNFKFMVAGNGRLAGSFAEGLIDAGLKCLGAISLSRKMRPTNTSSAINLAAYCLEYLLPVTYFF